jgi:uncharacterized membrane protein
MNTKSLLQKDIEVIVGILFSNMERKFSFVRFESQTLRIPVDGFSQSRLAETSDSHAPK